VHRLLAVLALAVAVAACGSSAPSSRPATASAKSGDLRLDLYVDRSVWRAGDLITGTTFFVNTGGTPVVAYGSGMGLVAYAFTEVDGSRVLDNVMSADCGPHDLPGLDGQTYRLAASGATSSDGADAWIAAANDAGGAKLPAGTWDITAQADFYVGGYCGAGKEILLKATTRVTVLP